MKIGLLACIALSALVSAAQAAPEPESASGLLRLSASQMDTATAGTGAAGVWITSAAAGFQSSQFRRSQFRKFNQTGANIQIVVKISGLSSSGSFDSAKTIVIPSSGGTINIGGTIFEGEFQ